MSDALHIDVESRSAADLKKVGGYSYFAHPTTDLWVACYAFGDGPIQTWFPGQAPPTDVSEHILLGGTCIAHNANFEMQAFRYVLARRYGWQEPAIEQWRCTMSMAYSMALPGSLQDAAAAVGLETGKDMVGRRLMLQMARPRKVDDKGTITWWDDPEKVQRLAAYCAVDVEVERELERRLRPLSKSEQALWHLDQHINLRGVLVDKKLANAAKAIVGVAALKLNVKMRQLTDGDVSACSNRNQLVKWVRDQGVDCDSIAKAAMEELLAEDNPLPPLVRQVLLVRQESAKASVAKIDALLNGSSPEDGRAKGLLQFHGASTGRWGGRRFQPQNIKRPDEADIDTLIGVVATGDFEFVQMLYDQPLSAVGDILRGLIVADKGHRIVAADYSNIEGRVLAWLAGERWKLDAFRAFDAGTGPDLYIKSYAETFNTPLFDKKDPRRQIGKTMELAGGFQGAHGAYLKFLTDETLADLVRFVREAVTEDEWQDAAKRYPGHQLAITEWTALAIVIGRWRDKHPAIKSFWFDIENAAIEAVQNRGSTTSAGPIRFKQAGSFLFAQLPSRERFLCYPYPEIRSFEMPWRDSEGNKVFKNGLTYFTVIDVTKKAKIVPDDKNSGLWARVKTYGGELTNNVTQATARDVMKSAMLRLDPEGQGLLPQALRTHQPGVYPIVLTVHDEIVCEVPDGHGSVEEMEAIMCDLPEWAAGLPISAEGFEGERYRK